MASSTASIRNIVPAVALAACIVLPACGSAAPIQKAEPMTTTDMTSAAARHADAGRAALDAGDYARANTELDSAIAAIGDGRVDTRSLDDTGMQLTMANAKARQGDMAGAAKLKAQVVRARLARAGQ